MAAKVGERCIDATDGQFLTERLFSTFPRIDTFSYPVSIFNVLFGLTMILYAGVGRRRAD